MIDPNGSWLPEPGHVTEPSPFSILLHHTCTPYQVPHLLDSLSGFYQLLDARLASFSKLCRVQGKLELLLAQGAHEEADTGGGAMSVLTTPLLALTAGGGSPIVAK